MVDQQKFLKVYNILLMGQTGVGKSTFINSISNYFLYETLTEALNANRPSCVIKTEFNLTYRDADNRNKNIKVKMEGLDPNDVQNEQFEDGKSCTQQPRVYSFRCQGIEFNIIDVPGVGDTRGTEVDMVNKQAIFQQIGRFEEIHGICIMLKAQTNKLTPEFKFCLNEILSCLSRSAIENLFFIVTYAAGDDFTAGQVSAPLRSYLSQLNAEKNVNIDFDNNVHCIDNESFRFQIGWHQSKDFRDAFETKVDKYETSWRESRLSVFSLFKKMYLMNAHKTDDTMGVARASTAIQCIIGPLSKVMGLVAKLSTSEFKQQAISSLMGDGTLDKPDVEVENIDEPQMVCANPKCLKATIDPKTQKKVFNFSQICHQNCKLLGVVKAKFPEPALEQCQMIDLDGNCRKCRHNFRQHIHVAYKTIQTYTRLHDEGRQMTRNEAEQRFALYSDKVAKEKTQILTGLMLLTTFLREHAIIEYNTAFEEKIKLEIRTEEANQNQEAVKKLTEILNNYKERVKMIDTVKHDKINNTTTDQVVETLRTLFKLPIYGSTINKLYLKELPPSEAADAQDFIRLHVKYIPDL
uniref:G domain-containing protein n=1 Tax=Panagrolaimus sp. JU765 TaxID=591449 RepID=A0AC34QME5_9BILA